ncbi:MAG TPA: transglycosylase SLT domain-containing protein [Terriglobia bacterium]|nr:transglycosylase SLT domain-containing protein [Terriglobia bacterium]
MKSSPFIQRLLLLALLAASLCAFAVPSRGAASRRLRLLAARARTWHGWDALRHYARSTGSEESRGLAYFTLGYREYLAGQNGPAAEDLKRAVDAECSLSNFAEYYEALANQQLRRNDEAIQILTHFVNRYPRNVYRPHALNLLAGLLIQQGHPKRALAVLNSFPGTMRDAGFLLLFAKAYQGLQRNLDAAQIYQQIYYGFPGAPEAHDAETALAKLRSLLGARFPQVSEGLKAGRVSKLFEHGLYDHALSGYDDLLLNAPHSPLQDAWLLGRAKCFLELKRYPEAVGSLSKPVHHNPEADAARLALLVRANELAGDQSSMLKALDEIYKKYPHSVSYGDALAYAGSYFARQGFWQTAAQYYEPLVRDFPANFFGKEASWRVAWYGVLAGKTDAAEAALRDFLRRYPDSPHTSAALYWLARIEDQQGNGSEARETDDFLARRFANTYYGLKAHRLLPKKHSGTAKHGSRIAKASLAAGPAALGMLLFPRPPAAIGPCEDPQPPDSLAPATTLIALSFPDLAAQYLQNLIARAGHSPNPEVVLALARLRSSQKDPASALFAAQSLVPRYTEYPFDGLPKEVWNLLYPRTYWRLVRRYARADRLDPYLVMGLIRQESAFNPRALSSANARGLMQIEPGTATRGVRGRRRRRRVLRNLYEPAYNIRVSCRYLRQLLRSFKGNLPETLAAYNAGDSRVRQWIENSKIQDPDQFLETIPFTDTRGYVERILRDRSIYRSLLSGTAKFRSCSRRQG